MKKNKIYLSPPHLSGNEIKNIKDAFSSNWISSTGPYVKRFESNLAKYCRRASACVVQSGTSAIHLAIRLLGVSQGDTVICQSFTFIGSCNPVIYEKGSLILLIQKKILGTCAQSR